MVAVDDAVDGAGAAYIDMSSPTQVVSNPEYFSDVIAGDVMTGAPNGPSASAAAREQSASSANDNYYNCPPPLPPPAADSMWAPPVTRQTSQV